MTTSPSDLVTGADTHFDEIWVQLEDGQALCALISGHCGWLMYLRNSGDVGFSSRNPHYDGVQHAEIEYRLHDGQQTRYPASWAFPAADVRRALQYFETEQRPPPWISWHNDSGDGAVLGDAT
jgi:hypothetical protein